MFEGHLVKLRPFELSDLDELVKKFNNYEMRRFIDVPIPYSKGTEEEWIRNTWERQKNGTGYYFLIENKETGESIGSIGLDIISQIDRTAHFGIIIFESKDWNKGFGTDSVKLMLSYGFDLLNLHSIYLRVYDYNERAIKVYENVGFKEVGRLREAKYQGGKYSDIILMDIIISDYQDMVQKDSNI